MFLVLKDKDLSLSGLTRSLENYNPGFPSGKKNNKKTFGRQQSSCWASSDLGAFSIPKKWNSALSAFIWGDILDLRRMARAWKTFGVCAAEIGVKTTLMFSGKRGAGYFYGVMG